MTDTRKGTRLGIFLNVGIGIVFIIAAVIVVISANYNMRQQALIEAQSKARIILDRNLATHTYFSKIMKPKIFEWSEPFRTKEYFDPTWMSSTFAIREIEKYFKSFSPSGYFFKDAALNARSPENEADEYERAFLEKLNADKKIEAESTVRKIDGKPYLVVLRKGEVMEASCLRCHSNPKDAPKGLTDYYGSERSFNRKAGDVVSAVSFRIPLSEAYKAANIFSLKLSALLLIVLACLFAIQYWFYRRYLLNPLNVMREKANQIAIHEEYLGEQIPQPFGRELSELTAAFNEMSVKLRHDRDHLEELVDKRTEELRESEERYRSLFENMLDGFAYCKMLYDEQDRPVDFVYLDVNSAFERLTGMEKVLGKQVSEVIPGIKESSPELFEIYGRVALTGKPEKFEIDFKPLALWLSISVYSTRKGYFVAVFDDITERKRVEEALQNSENKFRTLFEESRDAIYFTTREGELVDFNKFALDLFGYTREEFMKLKAQELYVHSGDRPKFQQEIEERGFVRDYEVKFRKKDGTEMDCLLTSTVRQAKDGSILGYQGITRDISERKRAEEEREKLIHDLQKALSEIKILKGILPICASCKKIRDDRGYWRQIEAYIRDHSEAEFSHGICPECKEKLYPGLD
jgi:PAS domain S-box-containing protein